VAPPGELRGKGGMVYLRCKKLCDLCWALQKWSNSLEALYKWHTFYLFFAVSLSVCWLLLPVAALTGRCLWVCVCVCVARMSGYEAIDTVHIVNGENEPMQFTFVESSCHAAGYTVSLAVEPMHGTVPPMSRFISCDVCLGHEFMILA